MLTVWMSRMPHYYHLRFAKLICERKRRIKRKCKIIMFSLWVFNHKSEDEVCHLHLLHFFSTLTLSYSPHPCITIPYIMVDICIIFQQTEVSYKIPLDQKQDGARVQTVHELLLLKIRCQNNNKKKYEI